MKDSERQQLKEMRRAAKAEHKAQQQQNTVYDLNGTIDVACVIHSTGYNWTYVDRLYNSVCRNLDNPIRFHVYTESTRDVPEHMIKHVLEEWEGIGGLKQSWWYKMQLFNKQYHQGPLLYFDLDTVIVGKIDWILSNNPEYLWALRDYKYLWKPNYQGINSSVMWFNTNRFDWVWQGFKTKNIAQLKHQHYGDQDYISEIIDYKNRRFFDEARAVSWRWQALDGGMDFAKRKHISPGLGTRIDPITSLLIFHGNPKPDQVKDPIVLKHWV